MEFENRTVCVLTDNGSLRPEAGLMTRRLSSLLTQETGMTVIAASLAHSDRIPAEKLEGTPIPLLDGLLESLCAQSGIREIQVIPFLLVTGGVIYRRIQSSVRCFSQRYPHLSFDITEGLVSESDPTDSSIAGMISEQIRKLISREGLIGFRVIVVDHGSPDPSSARVRNHIAARVALILGRNVERVIAASMERREGREFDFNEPLLERALTQSVMDGHSDIILAHLFLQPGRHNGKGGDIDRIGDQIAARYPQTRILSPQRVFSEKRLVPLLKRRLKQLNNTKT